MKTIIVVLAVVAFVIAACVADPHPRVECSRIVLIRFEPNADANEARIVRLGRDVILLQPHDHPIEMAWRGETEFYIRSASATPSEMHAVPLPIEHGYVNGWGALVVQIP